jgi:hypothetical protein
MSGICRELTVAFFFPFFMAFRPRPRFPCGGAAAIIINDTAAVNSDVVIHDDCGGATVIVMLFIL